MPLLSRRGFLTSGVLAAGACALGPAAFAQAAPNEASRASIAARRPWVPSTTINLRDYCAGDGATNDAEGFNRAVDYLNSRGGGTIVVPARTFRIQPRGWIQIPSNIAFAGSGPASKILLTSSSRGAYTVGFRVVGSNVSFDDLTLERGSDVYGSFFRITGSNVWLQGLNLVGRMSWWDNDFNGVYLSGQGANVRGLTVTNCTMQDCNFGIYQSEDDSSVVSDVLISNFTGINNRADDLEFCAPRGTITGVAIQDSTFKQNLSPWEGAGFAIGLANAESVLITGCSFDDYPMNPLHLERFTRDVKITNNSFVRASTKWTSYASAIFIISGSHDVLVADNKFDMQQQSNSANGIYVGPGGSGIDPYAITVRDNAARMQGQTDFYVNYGSGWDSVGTTSLLG